MIEYATRVSAELAQEALAVAGIPSVIEADEACAAYPCVLAGGASVLVDEADVDPAASVLGVQSSEISAEQPSEPT